MESGWVNFDNYYNFAKLPWQSNQLSTPSPAKSPKSLSSSKNSKNTTKRISSMPFPATATAIPVMPLNLTMKVHNLTMKAKAPPTPSSLATLLTKLLLPSKRPLTPRPSLSGISATTNNGWQKKTIVGRHRMMPQKEKGIVKFKPNRAGSVQDHRESQRKYRRWEKNKTLRAIQPLKGRRKRILSIQIAKKQMLNKTLARKQI